MLPYVNKAIYMNRRWKVFQTVKNSKISWDSKAKPKDILGGHLNIRSLKSKYDRINHLLADFNFFCVYQKLGSMKICTLLL